MAKKILLFITIFLLSFSAYSEDYLNFIPITSDDGLSQNSVSVILKDSKGFMWFGTADGLNRYDGKEFKVFKVSNIGENSIGANSITAIVEDSKGRLWIGTSQNGISIYFPKSDSFAIINHIEGDANSLSENNVVSLLFDKEKDRILVGYFNGEIDVVDVNTYKINHLSYVKNLSDYPSGLGIISLNKDSYGQIWIGSGTYGLFLLNETESKLEYFPMYAYYKPFIYNSKEKIIVDNIETLDSNHIVIATIRTGIIIFDVRNHSYEPISPMPSNSENSNLNLTTCVEKINDSILWIGTVSYGIVKYNVNNGHKEYYNTYSLNNNLSYNNIYSIYKDNQGIIWVSLNGNGLCRYSAYTSFFKTLSNSNSCNPDLNFISVRSIFKSANNLWVGGYMGLDKIDLLKHKTTSIINNLIPYDMATLSGDKGYLWAGFEVDNRLMRLDMTTDYISFFTPTKFVNSEASYTHFKILPVNDTLFWLGSAYGTIQLFNYKKREIVHYISPETDSGFLRGNIQSMFLRKNNQLWIGSSTDGILVIDATSYNKIYRFRQKSSDIVNLNANTIKTIIEDKQGTIWVGTANGLYHFNDSTSTFKGYFVKDGLPNNTIYGVLEDKKGFLWLSTNQGISRFNPNTERFVNFDKKVGLQGNEFNTNAWFKDDKDGFFCFGGINGLTYFYPEEFMEDTTDVPIVFTDLSINDKPVKLYPTILYRHKVDIPTGTYNVELTFAGTNYLAPNNIQYRYKINNGDWIMLGTNNHVILGLLKCGKNTFTVNASNTQGIWSSFSKTIILNHLRPFYFTTWFLLVMVIILIAFIVLIIYLRTYSIKRNERILKEKVRIATEEYEKVQKQLELKISQKEVIEKELKISNAAKDKIFSIIAHDLVSPFNSLLGFSDLLVEQYNTVSKDVLKGYINAMHTSSNRLYYFVQNLLYWSRAQQNKIKAYPELLLLKYLVDKVIDLHKQQAEEKKIEIFNYITEDMEIFIDRNLFHTILRNLISNAIKFTYPEKKIEVSAKKSGNRVIVSIYDEGIGMDKQTLENIFNSSNKISTKGTNHEEGTGLGLLIVKEFVEMCDGTVSVESNLDKGSVFHLNFPAVKS